MTDANGSLKERIVFLEAEQAKDRASLRGLQQTAETIRQNVLVRAGRIDELKRLAATTEVQGVG